MYPFLRAFGWLLLPCALGAQTDPALYIGADAGLTIRDNTSVTILGDFRQDFDGRLLHDGLLTVSGLAEFAGSTTITLRGDTDHGTVRVGGQAALQDGSLEVRLAEGYLPTELTTYNWLLSDTKVDGPFDAVTLPGDGWSTAFDDARHAVIFDLVSPVSEPFASDPNDRIAVRLWPNPTAGELQVAVAGHRTLGPVPYRILDVTGRTVQRGALTFEATRSVRLPLADRLSPGSYFLRLVTVSHPALPFILR